MIDLVVLVSIVLVLTAIVYVLVILSTKEKSFEEALKEQRQKVEQEHAQQKADKLHKKSKLKKSNKAKKDESDTGQNTLFLSSAPSQFEPEAEVRNNVQDSLSSHTEPENAPQPTAQAIKKKGKKTKPERHEEHEAKKLIVQEVFVEKTVAPVEVAAPVPVQPAQQKPEKKEQKKEKVVEAPVVEIKVPEAVEAKIQATSASSEKSIAIVDKKVKKEKEIKKEKVKVETSASEVSTRKLLQLIEKVNPTGTEIQSLIDSLLQLGGGVGGEWVEKGRIDPTVQLRRQLEDMEGRLKEQQDSTSALSTKITDLRAELNTERSRGQTSRRQLESITTTHQKQMDNAVTTAKERQNSAINELKTTLEQDFQLKLQQQKLLVNNEGEQVQAQVQQLKSSLHDAELRISATHQEHEELLQRCQKYEQHITSLEEKHTTEDNVKSSQLSDFKGQLSVSEVAHKDAVSSLNKCTNERDQLSIQVSQLTQDISRDQLSLTKTTHSLQEALREKTDVENRFGQLQTDLNSSNQIVREQNSQIECLKEEKESLASQSVRPAAEGQENGDVHLEQNSNSSVPDSSHLEHLVKEKEQIIEQQNTEVSRLKKEVSRLEDDVSSQKHKNDELRTKNRTVFEALNSTEDKLRNKINENNDNSKTLDDEHRRTRECLARLYPDIQIDSKLDQAAFLEQFETKAAQVKPKEVVVEKIVEKVVEDKELKNLVENLRKENDSLKSRVVEKVEDKELKNLVENLRKENDSLKSRVEDLQLETSSALKQSANNSSEKISQVEADNKALVEKVAHYQKVLGDTEALLKSLQASVEGEESAWHDRLADKDTVVHQLTADKANLQNKVQQLENTLEKVKQAEELQDTLQRLRDQLQNEEKEKTSLQEQLIQAQDKLATTATQDEDRVTKLEEDNNILRGLVNVGQDSNRQQEQLISQLQEELSASKNASTNGPSSVEQCTDGGVKQ